MLILLPFSLAILPPVSDGEFEVPRYVRHSLLHDASSRPAGGLAAHSPYRDSAISSAASSSSFDDSQTRYDDVSVMMMNTSGTAAVRTRY